MELTMASEQNGLKMAFLFRLCPVTPLSMFSWIMGVSSISVRDYVLATFGILPVLICKVYLGANLSSV